MIRSEHSPEAPLSIHAMTVAYERLPVLWDIDVDIPPGALVGVIGPNGAGKSTLIKAALGLVPKLSGDVQMFGRPYAVQRERVAYVPQRESIDWDFPVTVLDVVCMGLYYTLGMLRPVNRRIKKKGLEALEEVGLQDFRNVRYHSSRVVSNNAPFLHGR